MGKTKRLAREQNDPNETQLFAKKLAKGFMVKSGVRAGGWSTQHNETMAASKRLKVKSGVRAGGWSTQHNETLMRR
jgi:hypothetical protein